MIGKQHLVYQFFRPCVPFVLEHLEQLVYSTIAMYSGKSCQQTVLENSEHHALFVQRTLLCVQCLCTLASTMSLYTSKLCQQTLLEK